MPDNRPSTMRLFLVDAVNRNILIEFVDQHSGAQGVVRIGKVLFEPVGERVGVVVRLVSLLVTAVGLEHVGEHGGAIDGVVERLRGARAVGILIGVLLVVVGFLCRALHSALPVAAELVVDEVEGGKRGPSSSWVILDDFAQLVFIHLLAHVGVFLTRGRPSGCVGFFDLPLDVGGAPGGGGRQR